MNPNRPRCPVDTAPLDVWATIAASVRASCPECGWTWAG